MSIKLGGGKSKGRTSSGPSADRQAKSDEIWRAAQGAAGQVPTSVGQAGDYYGRGMTTGQTGLDALGGNVDATRQLMNPYQQQVIDRMNEQFQYQNTQTANQMIDAATRAGAFGGSRHGVATGVALGENQRNQGMQMAGLLQGGFDQTMNRAGQLAGYGMGAAERGSNLGMTAGSPDLWRMNILKQGVAGQPYRTTGRTKNTQLGLDIGASVPGFGGK